MDRWDRLFADLDRPDLPDEGEVAELVEAERTALTLANRLRGSVGRALTVRLDHALLSGVLDGVGADWLLLRTQTGVTVVALAALVEVSALANAAPAARIELTLPALLRRLAREADRVVVSHRSGSVAGTLTVVAADHVEVRTDSGDAIIPLPAIAAVTAPGGGALE